MQQAKANSRKIEDYKLKLRQSAMGGLITNDLKNKLDKVQREYSILRKQNQEHEEEKEGEENVLTVQLDA